MNKHFNITNALCSRKPSANVLATLPNTLMLAYGTTLLEYFIMILLAGVWRDWLPSQRPTVVLLHL